MLDLKTAPTRKAKKEKIRANPTYALNNSRCSDRVYLKTYWCEDSLHYIWYSSSFWCFDATQYLRTNITWGVARAFRRILSLENPPAKEVINSGVLPEFVQMLTYNDKPEFSLRLCGLLPTLHLLILPKWWSTLEPSPTLSPCCHRPVQRYAIRLPGVLVTLPVSALLWEMVLSLPGLGHSFRT